MNTREGVGPDEAKTPGGLLMMDGRAMSAALALPAIGRELGVSALLHVLVPGGGRDWRDRLEACRTQALISGIPLNVMVVTPPTEHYSRDVAPWYAVAAAHEGGFKRVVLGGSGTSAAWNAASSCFGVDISRPLATVAGRCPAESSPLAEAVGLVARCGVRCVTCRDGCITEPGVMPWLQTTALCGSICRCPDPATPCSDSLAWLTELRKLSQTQFDPGELHRQALAASLDGPGSSTRSSSPLSSSWTSVPVVDPEIDAHHQRQDGAQGVQRIQSR